MSQQTASPSKFKIGIGVVLVVYAIYRIVTVMIQLPSLMRFGQTDVLVYGLLPGMIALVCLWIGGRMLWPLLRSSEKSKTTL